ncbi:MAG: L,D-transpeptidase [Oculatellaceae cyanobacterium bins.114]|nr:L,D-transpeptidase [Oculatellaceae cyanobacterium bins.114]
MGSRWQLYRVLSVGLTGAIALVTLPSSAIAQVVFAGYVTTPQINPPTPILEPRLPALEVPPLQPELPNPSQYQVRLLLRLGERRVYVYRGNEAQVSYPVAVGREGWETPTGNFQVLEMVRNPGWTHPLTRELVPPGPTNPLGERWIAFWTDGTDYIGFHGTPNRESVGRAASHGCIRMLNEHVRELYEMVAPGTQVIVMP